MAAGVTVNTPPPWVRPGARPLISAHRCGAGGDPRFDNTRAGIERAAAAGGEYVEFDVQRCADGALVLGHDHDVVWDGQRVPIELLTRAELEQATGETCSLEVALGTLRGRRRAHIDLKFTSPAALYATPEHTFEAQAAQIAQAILGDGGFIITSLEDESVRAVRDWADSRGVALPVGLSLGRGMSELPWAARAGVRVSELFPARRVAAARANLIAAHQRLARANVARWSARHGQALLVWTVDEPAALRAWLSDPRVWVLTTNQPELAARIRAELAGDA